MHVKQKSVLERKYNQKWPPGGGLQHRMQMRPRPRWQMENETVYVTSSSSALQTSNMTINNFDQSSVIRSSVISPQSRTKMAAVRIPHPPYLTFRHI